MGDVTVTRHEAPTLSEMCAIWNSLPGGAVHTPFQTPAFVDAFQHPVAPASCSHFLVLAASLKGAQAPHALLPVVTIQKGGLHVVTLPDQGLADQNAPVLSRNVADDQATASLLCDALLNAVEGGDLVDVPKLLPLIGTQINPLFHREETVEAGGVLIFDAETLATVGPSFGKSVYKEAQSKFRKLRKAGVVLEEMETPSERLACLEMLLKQRAERFASLGREDSLQTDNRADFYRALGADAGSLSPFKILALRKGREFVASVALMVQDNIANGVLVSMGDPSWRRLSPGIVLLVQTIQWARDRNIESFSFGTGLQAYKQRFGAVEQPSRRLLLPLSLKGKAFVTALRAREAARTMLDHIEKAVWSPGKV